MNDELITRLRAEATVNGMPLSGDLRLAAADALEAAQAEAVELAAQLDRERSTVNFNSGVAEWWHQCWIAADAERDAEAALADQLAEALFVMHQGFCPLVVSGVDTGAASDAYRAHRERRTTPTKENTDG